jgi:hypothetical protein
MAITVIVVGLTLQAFIAAQQTNQIGSSILETNQNVRAGMSYLTRDLMQTGNGIPTGGIPVPSGTGSRPINRPGPASGMTFPAGQVLQAITTGRDLGPTVDGQATDLITVLFADRSVAIDDFPLAALTSGGARARVDARTPIAAGPGAVQSGDIILFSNALGNALQTVTGTDGGQTMAFDAGDPFAFNQQNTQFGGISALHDSNGVFPPTTATRVTMVTYYIDAVSNPQVPRLVRCRNFEPARPVALVIDNLQITYDLVDGSNTINPALVNVPTAVAPNTAAQIRKINLYLSGRSETIDTRSRQRFRTNLATQLSLRGLAFVNRYQ